MFFGARHGYIEQAVGLVIFALVAFLVDRVAEPIVLVLLRDRIEPANAHSGPGREGQPIQLFVDAFAPTNGMRLLDVARPALLMYGLYGGTQQDPGGQRLLELVHLRNLVAEQIDCSADCNCDVTTAPERVMLDRILYDLDRAIDYYAVSSSFSVLSEPEVRAATYGFVITDFLLNYVPPTQIAVPLTTALRRTINVLWAGLPNPPAAVHRRLVLQELESQFRAELRIEGLARSLSAGCAYPQLWNYRRRLSFVRYWYANSYHALSRPRRWPTDALPPVLMPPPSASSDATLAFGRPPFWQFEPS